ncbi:MAG: hypothetical protein ACE5OT_00400 [Candidatus Hadarchaeaceae archaeon]
MEQIVKDERISSIEVKLNSLIQRLSDLERRLNVLERSAGTKSLPSPPTQAQPTKISHNYLNRAISKARRDYERKYR